MSQNNPIHHFVFLPDSERGTTLHTLFFGEFHNFTPLFWNTYPWTYSTESDLGQSNPFIAPCQAALETPSVATPRISPLSFLEWRVGGRARAMTLGWEPLVRTPRRTRRSTKQFLRFRILFNWFRYGSRCPFFGWLVLTHTNMFKSWDTAWTMWE